MHRYRYTLPLAVVAVAAATATLPAVAAGTATPAAGRASSSLTLASVSVGGTALQALKTSLATSSLSGAPTANVSVTSLLKDGAALVPPVTVDQDTSNQPSVPSKSTSIAGVLGLTSPAATVKAARTATGAVAQLSAAATNGVVTILGSPVKGSLGLDALSNLAGSDASSTKGITASGLALPSVLDLLKGLGLDLSALPTDTLLQLVQKLNLMTPSLSAAVDSLNSQISALQSQVTSNQSKLTDALKQVDTATASLQSATANVQQAQQALTSAQAQLASAVAAVDALPGIGTLGGSASNIQSNSTAIALLPGGSAALATFNTAYAGVQQAQTDLTTNQGLATTAQDALNTANALVNQIKATLADLASQLDGLLAQLRDPLSAVLDGTPLVSLAKLDVHTLASAGTKHVADVTGTVSGLNVMGTDVLKTVTGSSSIDAVNLVGSTLSSVTAKVQGILGTVSSVLSNVASLPELKVPAPTVSVLQKATSLSPVDGLQAAQATLTALRVDWAGITIPSTAALPVNLPAVQHAQATLGVPAVSLALGTVSELAQSRPGTAAPSTPTSTPGTKTGTPLPRTGLAGWVPITALVLVGAGFVARRRLGASS